jgi:hypothetical protein
LKKPPKKQGPHFKPFDLKTLPNPSKPFQTLPNPSTTFKNLQKPSKTFKNLQKPWLV